MRRGRGTEGRGVEVGGGEGKVGGGGGERGERGERKRSVNFYPPILCDVVLY
jgi:hypothetical protein